MNTAALSYKRSEIKEVCDQFSSMFPKYKRRRLNKEEEIFLSKEIHKTRSQLWYYIFSYAPYTDGIIDFASKSLKESNIQEAKTVVNFDDLRKSAKNYRSHNKKETQQVWENARFNLALVLGKADADSAIAEKIVHMIEGGYVFGKQKPRDNSYTFIEYKKRLKIFFLRLQSHKHEFFNANVFLAINLAKHYAFGFVPFSDLVQQAMLGLMNAVERYDWRKGFRFSTYAGWWIRHAITRHLDKHGRTIRIPSHALRDLSKIRKAKKAIALRNENENDNNLISKETNISVDKVKSLLDLSVSTIPMEYLNEYEDSNDNAYLIDNSDSAEEKIIQSETLIILNKGLESLEKKDRYILEHRYGLNGAKPKKLREIAEEFGLSRESIRQLQVRAEKNLQKNMQNARLEVG